MRNLTRGRGYTLIEIIVVISVIGILATVVTIGFNRFQADARDAQRSTATASIVEALEKYFDENGEYPGCPTITGDPIALTDTVLPSLEPSILVAPGAPSNVQNSIKCEELNLAGEDFFEYRGTGGAGCSAGAACLGYTLRYKSETNNDIIEIQSRRTTPVTSTGNITNLTATASGFYTVNLSWGRLLEADAYRIQYATNSTFTTGLQTVEVEDNSTTISGLSINTQYFFRVTQLISNTPGAWSNTANATTFNLVAPVIASANVASTTSVTVNWNNVANEQSYTLRYSTSSTFASGVSTIAGIAANSTSRTVTGLTTGTTYYFQVRAENGAVITAWSNTANATPIGSATISSTSASACGQVTVNWSAVAGAATYTLRHSASSAMTSATTITGVTGTSRVVTGLPQGATRYFTLTPVTSSGFEGGTSAVASRLTTVCPPGSHSVSRNTSVTTGLQASSNASCASGVTPWYQWYANGSAWVSGTGSSRQTVTYNLNYGQGITLTVSVRCQTASAQSSLVAATNSVSYTRPGMNLQMSTGADGCAGSFCGREVFASWTNVCNAARTSMSITATQLSYTSTFTPEATTSHSTRWRGASSPGVTTTYNVNISCTSQSRSVQVISAYRCTGCS